MRLTRVEVENLRAISEPVILDGLGAFEVLHGANNAGKSSLLEGIALGLHLARMPELQARLTTGPLTDEEYDEQQVRAYEDLYAEEHPLLVDLSAAFPRLALHRNRTHDLLKVRLDIAGETLTSIEAQLRPAGTMWEVVALTTTSRRWGSVAWCVPELGPSWCSVDAHRSGRLSLLLPKSTVSLGGTSWDRQLLDAMRIPENSAARLRKRRLQERLGRFAPELGEGTLEEVGSNGSRELAWVDAEGNAKPFSEEGSGLQAIKTMLVATLGTGAQVALLEEPEISLSASATERLRQVLLHVSRSEGTQFLISSHVHGFDGAQVWRLWRDEAGVVRAQRDTLAVDEAADELSSEQMSRAMRRAYGDAGQPHTGFVTRDGITRVPESMLDEIAGPSHVVWTRLKPGVFGMITAAAMLAADLEVQDVDTSADASDDEA